MPRKDNIDYCTHSETEKFKASMGEFTLAPSSPKCMDNCNEVNFNFIVTSNRIDPAEACESLRKGS
jgi:hypothetical protein